MRQTIKEVLQDYVNPGKGQGRRTIALTSDSWTSDGHESFTAVTAHFIDDNWEIHSFVKPPPPHPPLHFVSSVQLYIYIYIYIYLTLVFYIV